MKNFIYDVWNEFGKYYDKLVELMPRLLLGIMTFLIVFFAAKLMRRLLAKYMARRTEELLIAQFVVRMIYLLMIIFGIVVALDIGGLDGTASNLLAGAGLSAIILGFAFKDIGENFLAGILLAFKRPFRIGDLVEIQGIKGRITNLDLRETLVNTYDGKDVFIPNAIIVKNPIVNFTLDGNFRDSFVIGLDYSANVDEAIDIIFKTISSLNQGRGTGKDPLVSIKDFGSSTINLEVFFWIFTDKPEFNIPNIRTVIMTEVLNALTKADFYIPSPIMEIKNHKNQELVAVVDKNE
ncbi:MAG TPA: mechanosensitive ion channel domain-containing protein [Membranihabitans sp.]|nr:mechanosensitive ion channel domain-containing protein [Membranihabitans sp.]